MNDRKTIQHRCRVTSLAVILLAGWPAGSSHAQSPEVSVKGDSLHMRAPAFDFIGGEILRRLKDGG